MKLKSIKINKIVVWVIIGLYLAVNSFYNLLPLGLAPDIVFIGIIAYEIIDVLKNNVKFPRFNRKEFVAITLIICMVFIYIIANILQGQRALFDTFFTAREMLYLLVFYYFAKKGNYSIDVVKVILTLEFVASLLYFINFIIGQPISPIAPYGASSVQIGAFTLYRDHSLMPNLQFFSCSYLYMKLIKKEYVFNKRTDTIYLVSIILATFLKMFRTKIALLVVCFLLAFFLASGKKKVLNMRKIRYGIIAILAVIAVMLFMPTVRERFVEAFTSVQNSLSLGQYSAYQGTGVYRLWMLESRINYLNENDQLLFGMGLISSRDTTQYFTSGSDTGIMSGSLSIVYNSDSAFLTLLPRYGMFGMFFYLLMLILISIGLIKQKSDFSRAVGIFIVCQMLEGVSGNGTLAETGPLLIGLLVGLAVSERRSSSFEVERIESMYSDSNIQ